MLWAIGPKRAATTSRPVDPLQEEEDVRSESWSSKERYAPPSTCEQRGASGSLRSQMSPNDLTTGPCLRPLVPCELPNAFASCVGASHAEQSRNLRSGSATVSGSIASRARCVVIGG
jgi:hypothetical protein